MQLTHQPNQLDINHQGKTVSFHPLWLRERSCEQAVFDINAKQRLYDPEILPANLSFKQVECLDNEHIKVVFSDDHQTTYVINDLFNEVNGVSLLPERIVWRSGDIDLCWFTFDAEQNEAKQLGDILHYYHRYGFVLVQGLPAAVGEVVRFAERIGCVRRTNFGKSFDVISVKKPIDLAYTPRPLGAHTDNPYRKPVPGVQLLFCIENETSSGLSTIVDGFKVVEDLQQQNPQAYKILTTTPVRFRYQNKDNLLESIHNIIELDERGAPAQIRFSNRVDFVAHLSINALADFYAAKRLFHQMVNADEYTLKFRLPPGSLLMMNNYQLLHGRTGYNPSEGKRFFQGLYIDHDSTESYYRILKARQ